jgi:hypothetical protein
LAAGYSLQKFMGLLSITLQKTGFYIAKKRFQWLKPKYVADPYQSKPWTAGSQSADGGNRLAAIVLLAGISLLLQFKRFSSSMQLSAVSQ